MKDIMKDRIQKREVKRNSEKTKTKIKTLKLFNTLRGLGRLMAYMKQAQDDINF